MMTAGGAALTDATRACWSSGGTIYGLAQFVAERTRGKRRRRGSVQCSVSLDLSFWPLTDDDLSIVVEQLTHPDCGRTTSLTLHGCVLLTDCGISHLQSLRFLRQLDVSGCSMIGDASCHRIATTTTRLAHLDMGDCPKLTDSGVVAVVKGCKYLEFFSVRNNTNIAEDSIGAIGRSIKMTKKLRILDLSGCTRFSDESLIRLLEADCGVLYNLNMSDCTQIGLGLIGLSRIGSSTNIKKLCLRRLHITDSLMSWIAEGCAFLQHIDLSDCVTLSDTSLGYLFEGCRRIRLLNLTRCCNITDEGLDALAPEAGKYLQEIMLRHCRLTDKSLVTISSVCFLLETIDLFGVCRITDKGLQQLARKCRRIKKFDCSGDVNSLDTTRQSRVPHIGKAGISALGQYCSGLNVLRCNGATRVDDDAIRSVATGCPALEELSLRSCARISDQSMMTFDCPLLKILDLSFCTNVSDNGIFLLVSQGCINLEEINLRGLRQITDKSIESLVSTNAKLKSVGLRDCYRLSDSCIISLASELRSIEKIDLFACDQITDRSTEELKKCSLLQWCDFAGSSATVGGVASLARHLSYGRYVKGDLRIRPVPAFRQHRDYTEFLLSFQERLRGRVKAFLERKRFQRRRDAARFSCGQIQRVVRGFLARKRVCRLRMLSQRRAMAGIIITTLMAFFIRRAVGRLRLRRQHCVAIQRIARGYVCRQATRVKGNDEKRGRGDCKGKIPERRALPTPKVVVIAPFASEVRSQWLAVQWARATKCAIQAEKDRQDTQIRSILRLQRWWRRTIAFVRQGRRSNSALLIQSNFRRICDQRSRAKVREQQRVAAEIIQQASRENIRWKFIMCKIQQQEDAYKASRAAQRALARVVENRWFKYKAGCIAKLELEKKRLESDSKMKISLAVQRAWRVHRAVKLRMKRKKTVFSWKRFALKCLIRHQSMHAMVIQRMYRLQRRKWERQKAALVVQLRFRAFKKRALLKEKEHKESVGAAIRLQRCYRVFAARQSRKVLRNKLDQASCVIQRSFRSYLARKQWREAARQAIAKHRSIASAKKEEILCQKQARLLEALLDRTKNRAACCIQAVCKPRLAEIRREKEEARIAEIRRQEQIEEEQRLKGRLARKRNKGPPLQEKVAGALNGLSSFAKNEGQALLSIKTRLVGKPWVNMRRGAENSFIPKRSDTSHDESLESLRKKEWFDERLNSVVGAYALTAEDVFQLRKVFCSIQEEASFDPQNSVSDVTMFDFFDYIGENGKSAYGAWIFEAVGASVATVSFSEYLHVVVSFSMLGKSDIYRLMFTQVDERRGFLRMDAFKALVDTMTAQETVRHSKRTAIKTFQQHAVNFGSNDLKLFFDGFAKVLDAHQFIAFPLCRTQQKIRHKNLGERFWREKMKKNLVEILSKRSTECASKVAV